MAYFGRPFCGCWYLIAGHYQPEKKYLPQVDLTSTTKILATTSRTTLTQTFINPSKTDRLDEVQYTFPLYDGVSVVGFECSVAGKTIVGVVKEKQQARADYKEAVERGETAGLLEQLPEAADVFTTKIGNVPANEKVLVKLVYLGELKHDAETDGSRFTIPTIIAPRYGLVSTDSAGSFTNQASADGGIRILVDVTVEEGSLIKGLQSPSHPIAVTMGRTSSMDEEAFDNNHASATLTLGSTVLDKDFIIVVLAKGQDTPRALLETHSSIPDQRAIMTTLVPKFNLPNSHPEIVFVIDRSGSMGGKIETVVSAMKIFLKSLPIGVKFNICSFGSSHDFLFKKSKTYDQNSLQEALNHLNGFSANYGGTEMLQPVRGTVKNRYKDMPLEVLLLTDGQIWNQQDLFDFITKSAKDDDVRFFSLGIGAGASSSLVEGIARAGDGFAQFVGDNEKMDKRVVRMLKGALTPHIKDYSLEIKYHTEEDAMTEDFEIIESPTESLKVVVTDLKKKKTSPTRKVISLFNTSTREEATNPPAGRYDHLPKVAIPKIIQTPHKIPTLYPFNRTTVYLLMSEEACRQTPKAVILRATSKHGPLELEIPVQDVGHGQSIHQLAAKKAVQELEEGRGWITDAKTENCKLIKTQFEGRWDEIVEREAVRLGVQFQVGGKWCSFVAVEKNQKEAGEPEKYEEGWEMQEGRERTFGAAAEVYRSYPRGRAGIVLLSSGSAMQPRKFTHDLPVDSRFNQKGISARQITHPKGNLAPVSAQFRSEAPGMFDDGFTFGCSQASSGSPFVPSNLFGSATQPPDAFRGKSQPFSFAALPSTINPAPSSGFFGNNASNTGGGFSNTQSYSLGFGGSAPTISNSSGALFGKTQSTTEHSLTSNNTGHEGLFGKYGNPNQFQGSTSTSLFGQSLVQAAALMPAPEVQIDQALLEQYAKEMSEAACMALPDEEDPDLDGPPPKGYHSFADAPKNSDLDSCPTSVPSSIAGVAKADNSSSSAEFKSAPGGGAHYFSASLRKRKSATPPPPPAQAPALAMAAGYTPPAMRMSMSASMAPQPTGYIQPPPLPPTTRQREARERSEIARCAPLQMQQQQGVSAKAKSTHHGLAIDRVEDMEMGFDATSPSVSPSSLQFNLDYGSMEEEDQGVVGWAATERKKKGMSSEEKMHAIIALQRFDGAWELTSELLGLTGLRTEELKNLFGKGTKMQIIATIAAIVFLEVNVKEERDTWDMVVEKARGWVEGVVGKGAMVEGERKVRSLFAA